jgi:pimeloyl-ACP methyl ester carboxylesterase
MKFATGNSPRSMTNTQESTLDVPGARLAYEVFGSGPVLLLIPGGPADRGTFAAIAPVLAEHYTVVTYDPRGLSRSPMDDSAQPITVETQADDASRLLASVGGRPAYVAGFSGGGITALALAVLHPEQVRALVAHEPPVVSLLPEPEASQQAAEGRELYETYRSEGAGPAMAKFMAGADLDQTEMPAEQAPPSPEQMAGMMHNFEVFLGQMLLPMGDYRLDVEALRSGASRVVIGGGAASKGQLAERCAAAVADALGEPLVEFPGDHAGCMTHAPEFAEVLRRELSR